MTSNILQGKLIMMAFLAMLIMVPATVKAQTYQTYPVGYQYLSTQEQLNYLYQQVAQLQYLLNSLKANSNIYYTSNPYHNYNNNSYQNYSYDNYDYVVVRPGNTSSDIEVDTLSATNIDYDEADLRGEVDLNNESEAEVWIEYGRSSNNLDDTTSKKTIYDSNGDTETFTFNVDDLDNERKYYFRAVAEDEDGDETYGQVRSFTTDDDGCSNCSNDDDDDYSLSVSDTSIDRRDEVEVDWEIPRGDEAPRNWIGLFERGDSNKDYIEWRYIENDNYGTEEFTINDTGEFEFRLFLDDSYDDEVTSSRITVR